MSRSSSRKERFQQRAQQIEHTNQGVANKEPIQQLFVGGLKIKHKNQAEFDSQYKLDKKNRKKSFKSIANPLETIIQKELAKFQVTRNTSQKSKRATNKITKLPSKKQLVKQIKAQTCDVPQKLKETKKSNKKQVSQEKQTIQTDFVQKKMKIGHKGKTDAIKQFIIETLMKGKAAGNSLTIHKGTAQCINSPRRQFNKSEIPITEKEKYSIVLAQQKSNGVAPKRKSFLPPLPQNQLKINKEPQSKNVLNSASLAKNKKWVAMAKKMQKKQGKQVQTKKEPQSEQQIIEENIVQQKTSDVMLHIPEQIPE